MNDGGRSLRLLSSAADGWTSKSSTGSVAPLVSPISSAHGNTCSSVKSPSRRSENSCAVSWLRVSLRPRDNKELQHERDDFHRSASQDAQWLFGRAQRWQAARGHHPQPTAA